MKIDNSTVQKLISKIDEVIVSSNKLEAKFSEELSKVHPRWEKSAKNLIHYLALRSFDLNEVQANLSELGLSSLGRSEGYVMASLYAVRKQLQKYIDCNADNWKAEDLKVITFSESKGILSKNTKALLGAEPIHRSVRVMVSLSRECAFDFSLVYNLVAEGMDCARINCAHDTPEVWKLMVDNVKRANDELSQDCRIIMDLGGPKLRTGELLPGPKVMKISVKKNIHGKCITPTEVVFVSNASHINVNSTYVIPVSEDWLKLLQKDDIVYFKDTRERKRTFKITEVNELSCKAETSKPAYIKTGLKLKLRKEGGKESTEIGDLPTVEIPLLLKKGDPLILTKASLPGEPAQINKDGKIVKPAHISCTLPEVFNDVRVGESILLNDGKIEGKIIAVSEEQIKVEITFAGPSGSILRGDKGINLPESKLRIKGLTEKDWKDLEFVAKYADMVNLSFANEPEDVYELQERLQELNAGHVGIMLKIETKKGFKNFPLLLLSAMKHYPVGVMIARGDLAVEVGWRRLAEIQEELLWISEAAHMPVVWATQVLESLAKKGAPSRAEITDAAMSQRADCVMLNKGPHIIEAVKMLRDILESMQHHQYKKTPKLKKLKVTDVPHKQSKERNKKEVEKKK